MVCDCGRSIFFFLSNSSKSSDFSREKPPPRLDESVILFTSLNQGQEIGTDNDLVIKGLEGWFAIVGGLYASS